MHILLKKNGMSLVFLLLLKIHGEIKMSTFKCFKEKGRLKKAWSVITEINGYSEQ
jgi:hypothetical protein